MSQVTSVILAVSPEEEAAQDGEVVLVQRLNEWLLAKCQARLRFVSKFAGGRHRFAAAIYIGSFNFLPLEPKDGFVAFVKSLPWLRPALVQLFLKPANLQRFVMIYFSSVLEIEAPKKYDAKMLGKG